jgi:hypothetical protein|tara:strand:+ start:258 stop:389 length:132 start_codon:yes stop_codon:yes gene_type:complete
MVDMLMIRIDKAKIALDKSESDWSKQFWNNILAQLLRQGNRLN